MAVTRARPSRRDRPAFTIIEAVFSMLIIGVMLVAALNTLGATTRSAAAVADHDTTAALAESLMSEIMQAHFIDPDVSAAAPAPGLEADEVADPQTRDTFDDVDDYGGWSESPPQDRAGVALAGFSGYERSVTIEVVNRDEPDGAPAADLVETGLRRITVLARDPGGRSVTLVALRSVYSCFEIAPATETTILRHVEATVQIGSDGRPVTSGVSLLNPVEVEP